jgi:hypothetical protein
LLSVDVLGVVMLSVVMPSVIMLSITTPYNLQDSLKKFSTTANGLAYFTGTSISTKKSEITLIAGLD